MNKIHHLEWIQNTIHRYAYQSLGVKAIAITLFAVIMHALLTSPQIPHGRLLLTGVIGVLFTLWVIDGRYNDRLMKYVALYKSNAAAMHNDPEYKMELNVEDSVNVKAIWRPTVFIPYVVMLSFLSVTSFLPSL